jgi:dTDP-4-dehydrorhamnose 3,5-epimerase
MPFTFTQCTTDDGIFFSGLCEIQPRVFPDSRGYFFECYSERDFIGAGLDMKFVQDNQSGSVAGVLRGLHFQTLHPQGKLVRAVEGDVYDVAVDLRQGSPTFGKYYGVVLSSVKQNQFYIPQGFAHGFYVLSTKAVFAYKCTDFYHPEDEGGIPWNDPAIGIDWNSAAPGLTPLLADKDQHYTAFDPHGAYFDRSGRWMETDNL